MSVSHWPQNFSGRHVGLKPKVYDGRLYVSWHRMLEDGLQTLHVPPLG